MLWRKVNSQRKCHKIPWDKQYSSVSILKKHQENVSKQI